MLGAVVGDLVGSVYEGRPIKTKDFPLFRHDSVFTDDTVLTVAVADCVLEGGDYATALKRYGRHYPHAGYGGAFRRWLSTEASGPYNSWGNGSAMRVSPVGLAFDSADRVLAEAQRSAAVTHDHPEGIKGAQAVALAVFLGRTGADKDCIRQEIGDRFGYDLTRSLDAIRPGYRFHVSCQRSVPESIIAFLASVDFEDAVRNAVSLGGDTDTMGCIAGAIAEAFYGPIAEPILSRARRRLPASFVLILDRLYRRFPPGRGSPVDR